jgi:hypothetical protein
MSYARKGENSDVYVISTGYGYECINCLLKPRYRLGTGMINLHLSTICQTPDHMLMHLKKHLKKGHKVPERATKRLSLEADQKYAGWHKPPKSYRKLKRDMLTRDIPNPNEAFKK